MRKGRWPEYVPPQNPGRSSRYLRWTKEEDAILRAHYSKRGSRYTAEILGRSVTSVQHRALKLEIPGNGVRVWTEMEIRYLRSRYPNTSVARICRTLHRSEQSVRGQINRLGLGATAPAPWTDGEIAYLRSHYGRVKVAELADELGRSPDAVEIKAGKLGLSRKNVKLTDGDREYVLQNLGKIPYTKMAAKLGVDVKKLMRLAAKHGYHARGTCRPWTVEEDEFLRQKYGAMARKAIAEQLGRTVGAVGVRAGMLGLTKTRSAEVATLRPMPLRSHASNGMQTMQPAQVYGLRSADGA